MTLDYFLCLHGCAILVVTAIGLVRIGLHGILSLAVIYAIQSHVMLHVDGINLETSWPSVHFKRAGSNSEVHFWMHEGRQRIPVL